MKGNSLDYPLLYEIDAQQKGQWVLFKLLEEDYIFNMYRYFAVSYMDDQIFESSIKQLMTFHESLRTCFVMDGGQLKHKILPIREVTVPIEQTTYSGIVIGKSQPQSIVESNNEPFDLEMAPLFRVKILRFENKTLCVITVSHVICDPTSLTILLDDLKNIYQSEMQGKRFVLSGRKQFREFFNKTQVMSTEKITGKAFAYWRTRLSNLSSGNKPKIVSKLSSSDQFSELSALDCFMSDVDLQAIKKGFLPIDRIHWNEKEISFSVGKRIKENVDGIVATINGSYFSFWLSTFALLAFIINKKRNSFVAFPTDQRGQGFDGTIGWFVLSGYLNINIQEQMSFLEYWSFVQVEIIKIKKYCNHFSHYTTLEQNNFSTGDSVTLYLHFSADENEELSKFSGYAHSEVKNKGGVFDIVCFMRSHANSINFSCRYKQLYDREEMERYFDTYQRILVTILGNPSTRLCQLFEAL